ncbi:hypothetical protein EST38_g7979 [Candolleomyces aberdarensis]|uniref:DUF6593 domain-containing protein n=1 Tax=Candolleomyces aberdarensis TaxID=2316362 RepID=A0A4Q2DFY3_9AGAR|nr:hypothetical protein EST38_g7979 [Candolleomyces aberdarensis]
MQMHSLKTIPITLEDRTAAITNTDFDDMYDRVFYQVVRNPGDTITRIYEMHVRASRSRNAAPQGPTKGEPVILLQFQPDETLGMISFPKTRTSMPMNQFLRKISFFGSSLMRKFVASDGREYKWSYRSLEEQEWTCSTADDSYLVAHYDLKPPEMPIYDVSGNKLIIYPHFVHITADILASLLIMRHISQYNL